MTLDEAERNNIKIDSNHGRLVYLESLRGLAAILVVLHHHYMTYPILIDIVRLTPFRLLINGRSSVIFFFVLSGFVIVYGIINRSKKLSYSEFIIRRIIRIYLPYAAAGLIAILCYMLINPVLYVDTAITFNEMWSAPLNITSIAQFFLLAGTGVANTINTVAWSLVYELRISLLLPFLFVLGIRLPYALWLLVLAELITNRFRREQVPFYGVDVFTSIDITLHFLLPFILGVFLAIWLSQGRLANLDPKPIVAKVFLFISLMLIMIFRDEPASVGGAMLLFVAIRWSTLQKFLRKPILIKLGAISYSLYLTHAIVLQVTVRMFHGLIPLPVSLAVSLATCIPVAVLFYTFIEKPTHKLSQRLGRFKSV